jgi:hypothetical protein
MERAAFPPWVFKEPWHVFSAHDDRVARPWDVREGELIRKQAITGCRGVFTQWIEPNASRAGDRRGCEEAILHGFVELLSKASEESLGQDLSGACGGDL